MYGGTGEYKWKTNLKLLFSHTLHKVISCEKRVQGVLKSDHFDILLIMNSSLSLKF